jgi:sulfite reductase beta subunit-like hemoprotein
MHWLNIEDIPGIVERYNAVGLITRGACGDVCRNVVSSPLAGIDPAEALDPRALVQEASDFFAYNPAFNDMPRKFKVCISGNLEGIQSEVQEVVLYGVRRSDGTVGYGMRVGGGLSTEPYIAQDVRVFVTPERAMAVLEAAGIFYRDHGYRKSRKHARYKYLVADWGAAHYREVLEEILGYALPDAEPLPEEYPGYEDHYGVHPQKQEGLSYVGAPVVAGRLNADQLDAIGDIAEEFGTGDVRLTVMQSFYIINVPHEKTGEVVKRLGAAGLPLDRSAISRGVVACTGIQFCNLAVTETKERAQNLVRELDQNVQWKASELFRINVNGCPNSCGQHWVADVGLQGCTKKVDGELKEHFDMFLGGGLGSNPTYNRRIKRVIAEEVAPSIQHLIEAFEAQRQDGESFKQFCARHDDDALEAMLTA